jgi:hypothetical protein
VVVLCLNYFDGVHAAHGVQQENAWALKHFGDEHPVNRLIELGVEVMDAEFVEVAEHDVGRAAGDEVKLAIERLLEVLGELCAAGLHFDEAAARPDEVGEPGALTPKGELAVFEPSDKEYKKVASYKVADSETYAYPVAAGKGMFVKEKDSLSFWNVD